MIDEHDIDQTWAHQCQLHGNATSEYRTRDRHFSLPATQASLNHRRLQQGCSAGASDFSNCTDKALVKS